MSKNTHPKIYLLTLRWFCKNNLQDETEFIFDGMICYIDLEFGSQCELIGTQALKLEERIKLHETKLKQYKKEIIQMKIPFGV